MSNNQLSVYQSFAFGELTQQDVVTIRETIGKQCDESQFKLFMSIAKAAGANPVMNEIYPTVRQNQLTVQFGVDFFVRKAKESDGYKGYDVQLVHENDEFKMHQEKAEDGSYFVVIDEHSWGFPRGKVIGGYCIAYKEGFNPFTVVMEVEEVEHFKRSQIGMQKTMWTNYFNDMFKKHMTRRALKAAFNLNFDDETVENNGGDNIPEYQPQQRERKDITPQQDTIQEPQQQEPEVIDPEVDKIKQARKDMSSKFKQLGITTKQGMSDYIAKNAPNFGDNPSYSDIVGLLSYMDMDIEMQEANATDDDSLE
ncbi:recombinase RecT [Niallia sp. Krafla_26]|uniref:recombinase RecT n=1 Tax=Niallia sp. Krafla_26 TaxID=3064703 RepID=UPI003D17A8C4